MVSVKLIQYLYLVDKSKGLVYNFFMNFDQNWIRKPQKRKEFNQNLLKWYNQNQRPLPWRGENNPYNIWISEIMSQQTRLETVIPYYLKFVEKYPSIATLANANDEELLKLWEGLGYYSRARNLKVAAKQMMDNFHGKFPEKLRDIKSLKGVGDYTAAAIVSIVYGQSEPAVDGNLIRVTSRLFELDVDISKTSSKKVFEEKLRELISHEQPGNFNQAFMDLGSGICTPKIVKCENCPIRNFCQSFSRNTMLNFPVKTKKQAQKDLYYIAFAIQNSSGEFFIKRRPKAGLLSEMWCFPLTEVTKAEYYKIVKKNFPPSIPPKWKRGISRIRFQKQFTHIFSHQKWHIALYLAKEDESFVIREDINEEFHLETEKWLTIDEIKRLPLAGPQVKMMEDISS